MNSTDCPRDTVIYLCSIYYAMGYKQSVVHISYDFDCEEYKCCSLVSSVSNSNFQKQLTTLSPDDEMSVSSSDATPLSDCKKMLLNVIIYLLIVLSLMQI